MSDILFLNKGYAQKDNQVFDLSNNTTLNEIRTFPQEPVFIALGVTDLNNDSTLYTVTERTLDNGTSQAIFDSDIRYPD